MATISDFLIALNTSKGIRRIRPGTPVRGVGYELSGRGWNMPAIASFQAQTGLNGIWEDWTSEIRVPVAN